jgi:hypothetical protein
MGDLGRVVRRGQLRGLAPAHSVQLFPWQGPAPAPRWLRYTGDTDPPASLTQPNLFPADRWVTEAAETNRLEVQYDEFRWHAVKFGTTIAVSTCWISFQVVQQVLRDGGWK